MPAGGNTHPALSPARVVSFKIIVKVKNALFAGFNQERVEKEIGRYAVHFNYERGLIFLKTC
jgi:hypothetical protein